MNTVYVPQQPSKWDEKVGLWIPQIDMRNAARYGDINIMFPPQASRVDFAQVMEVMATKLADFKSGDYLVALGSPAMIAGAAMFIAKKNNGYLKLLTWDRINKDYSVTEIITP